jgi:hypothetical protein
VGGRVHARRARQAERCRARVLARALDDAAEGRANALDEAAWVGPTFAPKDRMRVVVINRYTLHASIGTTSTFREGYLDDGSFGFGGSYMSAAHG